MVNANPVPNRRKNPGARGTIPTRNMVAPTSRANLRFYFNRYLRGPPISFFARSTLFSTLFSPGCLDMGRKKIR